MKRYTILGELARGGFGRVYSATDEDLERPVAIKLPIAPTAQARARFEREAKITARLQHAGVVPIYDVGTFSDGQPFFVMKLIEGQSLAEHIEQAPSLQARLTLVGRVLSVAETIAYAHGHGIIHRDLKPANVVLGEYGETLVIDWGLAAVVADVGDCDDDPAADVDGEPAAPNLTEDGHIIGTPAFMAPEQARGVPLDLRADVYALGAILFNVLAGHPPFAGDSKSTVIDRIQHEGPPPLRSEIFHFPPDLTAIVSKAMAREPEHRYADAGELAEDLRRFLDGQLVRAQEYSLGALAARWLRKHRVVVAVATVLLAGTFLWALVSTQRIVAERKRAVAALQLAESRENALAMQQAQRSVLEEPTAALAWLRRYHPSPQTAWLARAISEEAVARGAARHVFAWAAPSAATAVSPTAPVMAVGSKDGSVHLHRLDVGTVESFGRHPSAIADLAFCPRRFCLASVDVEGRLRLSEADHRLSAEVSVPRSANTRLSFSPDGDRLAVSPGQNTLILFDLGPSLKPHTMSLDDQLSSFAFCSGTGSFLLSDDGGRTFVLARGEAAPRPLVGVHPDARLVCLPDGVHFASAGVDGEVKLWNTTDGLLRTLGHHNAWVSALAVSPQGTHLASASGDDTVSLYDLVDGSYRTLRGHKSTVRDLVFTPAGDMVASVSYDAEVRVWQVPSAQPLAAFPAWQRRATRLYVASDGHSLVATGSEEARVWPMPQPMTAPVLSGHEGATISLDWSADGRLLGAGGRDGKARVWNTQSGGSLAVATLDSWVTRIRFSDDNRLLVSTRTARTSLFDPQRGKLAELVSAGPATAALSATEISSDRRYLAYNKDGRVWVHDVASGVKWPLAQTLVAVKDITFTRNGAEIIVMTEHGRVGVWRTNDGILVAEHQLQERPSAVTVSPDGRWLAVKTELRRLLLWDRATDQIAELPTDGQPSERQVFTRDSRQVAYTLADGSIRLFDVVSHKRTALRGHRTPVTDLKASPDGRMLATGDEAGFVRSWRIADGASRVLRSSTGPVQRLAFSPDGRRLAAALHDLTIAILPVDPTRDELATDTPRIDDHTTAVIGNDGQLRTPSVEGPASRR
jgi:eukaryotic-like serine/threonine-protein kinase